MPYRRRGYRSRGMRRSFSSSSGSLYGPARANFEFRRHVRDATATIGAGRVRIFGFLAYNNTPFTTSVTPYGETSTTSYDGETIKTYASGYVAPGSTVYRHMIDLLITPTTASDAAVLPFYTARIACSFHDIKSGDVRGLQLDDNDVPHWQNDAKDLPTTAANGIVNFSPELAYSKTLFDISYKLQHWWRGMRKTIMAAGQPVGYTRNESVYRKCIRSNPGMFFGMVFMNDSAVSMSVDMKHTFDEVPLVQ